MKWATLTSAATAPALLFASFFGFTSFASGAVVFETETGAQSGVNDTIATAQNLAAAGNPITVNGTIGAGLGTWGDGDVDFYKVSALAGSPISISVTGPTTGSLSPSGGTVDVALFMAGGVIVAYDNNSNSTGPANPARIVSYTPPSSGDYYVAISEWSNAPDGLAPPATFTPLPTAGYQVNGAAADATYDTHNGNVQHAGEAYVLTISGVPEPASVGTLAALALGALTLRRSRAHSC